MEQRYYAVKTKCGHVRRKKYIEITFAIVAESKKEAARKGREMPRVKHDHPMAILDVLEINYEEYLELVEINSNNPYLKCKNKQEQNINCPDIYKLVKDLYEIDDEEDYKEKRKERLEYLFKKRRILDGINSQSNYRLWAH